MTVPHDTHEGVPRQRRRRGLAIVAAGTLALAGLGTMNAGSASAESRTVTAGNLAWGIKASTFAYHKSHTGGTPVIELAGGVTPSSTNHVQYGQTVPLSYNWPWVSGTYDTTSSELVVQYGGSVLMKDESGVATCGPGCGGSPFPYTRFANPKVTLDFTGAVKKIDMEVTKTLGGTPINIAMVNLTVASPASAVADVLTYSSIATAATSQYQTEFGGGSVFAGDPLDPASFTATAPATATPTPTPPAGTPTPTPPAETPTPTPPAATPTPTPGGSVPASGNPVYALTGSSFAWSLADTFQYKGAGPCHGLSAGYVPNGSTTFNATAGNVSIVDGSGNPIAAAACTTTGSNIPIVQNVKFSGGSGFIDPATNAAVVNFTGSVTMLMNGGATPIRVTNPILKVNGDGTGTLTGILSSTNQTGATYQGNNKTIAKFTGIALGASGFTHTPDYLTKTIELPVGTVLPTVANQTGDWGAWTQDLVSFANLNGNAAFFYNTGAATAGSSQARKKTNPFTVVYGTQGAAALGGSAQTLQVTVQPASSIGEFSWRILQNATVNLGDPTPYAADKVQYTGALNQVEVTDARNAGTWALSGSAGNFALVPATTPATTFGGFFLGWTPSVVTGGANAVAGSTVAPGAVATEGLSSSRPLATGGFNGDPRTGVLGAALTLRIPATTGVGDYRATLTLTALAI